MQSCIQTQSGQWQSWPCEARSSLTGKASAWNGGSGGTRVTSTPLQPYSPCSSRRLPSVVWCHPPAASWPHHRAPPCSWREPAGAGAPPPQPWTVVLPPALHSVVDWPLQLTACRHGVKYPNMYWFFTCRN